MCSAELVHDRPQKSHAELTDWVRDISKLIKPEQVVWCDGSDSEWERLTSLLVENGTFTRLNLEIRPNSFYCASDPSDVARVEDRTFICAEKEEDAGPTNNWIPPDEMRKTLAQKGDLGILLSVDTDVWKKEAALIREHFDTFGDRLPSQLWDAYCDLLDRLGQATVPGRARLAGDR